MWKPELIERNCEIFRLVMEGGSFTEAGKKFGLSPNRVRQITFWAIMYALQHGRDEIPEGFLEDFHIKEYREHKDFWLARLKNCIQNAARSSG